jgi:RHS repeat-associated protein
MSRPSPVHTLPPAFTLYDRLLGLWDRITALVRWGRNRPRPPHRPGIELLEDRLVPAGRPLPTPVIYTGTGQGPPPLVRAFDALSGGLNFERTVADPGFTGGVRLATADFTGDGFPDLVVAVGPGGGPRVQVLDGRTGQPLPGKLGSFFAYDARFSGGLSVAAADVDGDGVPDVITGAGAGGGPQVEVFSGATGELIRSFFAFEPTFRGGVSIAAADFNGDGRADLAVGAGAGGGPRVRVFDLTTGEQLSGPLGNFFAFTKDSRGGVSVGADWKAGDVNGDGVADLVVGTGPGAPAEVKVYSGADGAVVLDFAPFGPRMTAGVSVATAYVDDDPYADVVVGTGPGVAAEVRVFSGKTGEQLAAAQGDYHPFGADALGGVSVAATNDPPGSGGSGGSGGTSPPVVWVSPPLQTTPEGSNGDVWVYRTGGDTTQPLTASVSIGADGQGDPLASWNVDYTLTGPSGGSSLGAGGGTVTFGANQTAVDLHLAALADNLIEPTEGFRLTVQPGSGYQAGSGGSGGSGGMSAVADVRITDVSPVVWVSPPSQTVEEGNGGGVWVYRTGGDTTQPLTANVQIGQDGAGDPLATWSVDYTLTGPSGGASLGAGGGTVTFGANQTAVYLSLAALRDNLVEPTEGFRLTVQPGSNYLAGSGGSGGMSATADVRITDDPAAVWVDPSHQTVAEGSSGGFWVYRSGGDVSAPLTVDVQIGPDEEGDPLAVWNTDYTLTAPAPGSSVSLSGNGGTVTFGAGQAAVYLEPYAKQEEVGPGLPERKGFELTVTTDGTEYLVEGPSGGTASGKSDVRIDLRPFPIKQSVSINQGGTATITLSSLAPAGDPVTYSLFGSYGTQLSLSGNVVTYTPNSEFVGDFTFYFQAQDQVSTLSGTRFLNSNLGVVRVHVEPAPIPSDGQDPPLPLPNEPPTVALIDAIQWAHAGETATVQATASDPDGAADITSVHWDFDYDGSNFTPDPSASTLTPAHTFSVPGTYVVAVLVTDSVGHSATDVGLVEVLVPDDPIPDGAVPDDTGGGGSVPPSPPSPPSPPPPPPAVSISASSTTIPVGGSVTFSVGGSGNATTWDFNYDGAHFDGTSFGQTVGHTFVGPGVYTVAVDFLDDSGSEQIATTTVTVTDIPAVVILPPNDAWGAEGEPVGFTGPTLWVDLIGQPDNPAVVEPFSTQWDFDYTGTFAADPSAAGQSSPSHLYAPGSYVAAVQLTDSRGNTGMAMVNVQVDELPPDVSAGSPVTANAGTPVTFNGTATDYSGIATVEWDFDYDGETFVSDPSAAGTLTPTHVFADPGVYQVALRAVDNDGSENIDVVSVTVNDVAPFGVVTLAPTRPDGTPQTLEEGSPVYFAVSGLRDTDALPDVWADWEGDGNYDLVTSDEWVNVTTGSNGAESFVIAHVFDDNGSYTPVFWVEDAEGLGTTSTVPLTVANVAPSGTFGLSPEMPTGAIPPGDPVDLTFSNVTDPSETDTDAGFTYHFQLDGGGYQGGDSPDYTLEDLGPGTDHTVDAYVEDKDGGQSQVYVVHFHVQSDIVVTNSGSGSVQLSFSNPDGTTGSASLAGGGTFTPDQEITGLTATLQGGGSYDLSTNFQFDSIDASGTTGATIEVHTDSDEGMPDFVGSGNVGPITLGANATLTVDSRGDFGGATAAAGSQALRLSFADQTGPITGFHHIGQIDASGAVSGVSVSDGVDKISAGSLGNVSTETDPSGPDIPIEVRVVAGGITGPTDYGNQPATIYELDSLDEVIAITEPDGNTITFTYDANGFPASMTDAEGTWTFTYDALGNLLSETDPDGNTRTITYDSSGQAVTDTTTDHNGNVIAQTTLTRDANGNPLTSTGAAGTTTFTYTGVGDQLQSETGPSGVTETYGYNAAGNVTSVTDSLGATTNSTYDTAGNVLSQTFTAPGQPTLRVDYTYNSANQVLTETRYANAAGTQVLGSASYAYDAAGRVTGLTQRDGTGAVVEDYVYTYDPSGRPLTETRNGVLTASYTYDAEGQVTGDGTHTYTYDSNGNRTNPGYQTGSDDRLLADGTWTYSYDPAGNVVGKTNAATGVSWAYRYDLDARLVHAEQRSGGGTLLQSADYKYDTSGQQVEKDTWTASSGTVVTRYAYANGRVAAVLDAQGNVTQRYLYGAGGVLVGVIDAAGNLSAVLTDATGSVRDVIGPGGTTHTDYGAFGEVAGGAGAAAITGVGWKGMSFDSVTGLYRGTVARAYDPSTGRWTSPDPERFSSGVSNLYTYAGNRPTTAADTNGLWWLRDAWNAVTTAVSNVATGVARRVQEVFRTVTTAAGNFVARLYDVWQAGVNSVTWLVNQAGEQLLVLGNQIVHAAKAAAEAFVAKLEQFGRAFADLWDKVRQFGAAASDVLWAIVQDPGGTLSKIGSSVGRGITDFFNELTTTLPNALLSWVTGGLSNLPTPLPTNWLDFNQVGPWLLDFFRLNWDGVRGLLAQRLGAGNVALISQAIEAVQTWAQGGTPEVFRWLQAQAESLTPQQILQRVIDAGVNYVVTNVVPRIVANIVAKFDPTGVTAILSTIWNTLTWISDNMERFAGLADLATTIANRIGGVVHDQPGASAQLANNVKTFLNGLIPVGLNFAASQLGLGNLPQAVGRVVETVRSYPLNLVGRAIDKVADRIKDLLGLNNHPEYQGLLLPAVTYQVGSETHRIWVVNQNGRAAIMRASNPTPVDRLDALLARYNNYDLRFVSAARRQEVATALTAAQTAVDQYRASAATAQPAQLPQLAAPATAALRTLQTAMTAAVQDVRDSENLITVPDSETAPAGVTAQQIADRLPGVSGGSRAFGALVVDGKIYRLVTLDQDLTLTNGDVYHHAVVPTGSPLIGRFGFTGANHGHIEQSAAAILRRLARNGTNVSGAFVVVNKTRVCYGNDQTCDETLKFSLPLGVTLQVYTMRNTTTGHTAVGPHPYTGE